MQRLVSCWCFIMQSPDVFIMQVYSHQWSLVAPRCIPGFIRRRCATHRAPTLASVSLARCFAAASCSWQSALIELSVSLLMTLLDPLSVRSNRGLPPDRLPLSFQVRLRLVLERYSLVSK